MQEQPDQSTNPFPLDGLLDRMRQCADEPADRIMSAIVAERGPGISPRDVMDDWRVREFMRNYSALPGWADPARIEQGQTLFFRYGMTIVTLLFFSALPEGYACGNPARVLCSTGTLGQSSEVLHRILRTAQFIIDVMQPAGLRPGGRGIATALQIRLLHATIRAGLRDRAWDPTYVPINQEDMAGTLSTFSVLMLAGMRRFDHDFTEDEAGSYVHVWNVVGYLLGVREELLESDPGAALVLFERIKTRIQVPCDESLLLTRTLLDFLKEMIPGEILDGFADTLMRCTIGDRLADGLGIPHCDWTESFMPMLSALGCWTDEAGDRWAVARHAFGHLNTRIIEGLMAYYTRESVRSPVPVEVPAELQLEWGIARTA